MKVRKFAARLGALGLVLVLLSVAGCFDYEVALDLKEDGAGTVTVALKAPAYMAQQIKPRDLETLVLPPPVRQQRLKDGQVILTERSGFANLDDVAAWRLKFKVERTGLGFMGIGSDSHTITCWLEGPEGNMPNRDIQPGAEKEERVSMQKELLDPAAARARQLLDRSMGRDHLVVSFQVPGQFVQSWPLVVNKKQVPALYEMNASKVVWKVPMSVLITQNVRHDLVFRAQFKGGLEYRTEGRTDAVSRFATAEDVAMAEQEKK